MNEWINQVVIITITINVFYYLDGAKWFHVQGP